MRHKITAITSLLAATAILVPVQALAADLAGATHPIQLPTEQLIQGGQPYICILQRREVVREALRFKAAPSLWLASKT